MPRLVAQRISPPLLTELIGVAGRRFDEHVMTLDLDAPGGPVSWATGGQPAPAWLDVAREYLERYVHQQQIRAAWASRPSAAGSAPPWCRPPCTRCPVRWPESGGRPARPCLSW